MGEKYMFVDCGLQKIYNKLLLGVDFCKDEKKQRIRVGYRRLWERYGRNRYDGMDND